MTYDDMWYRYVGGKVVVYPDGDIFASPYEEDPDPTKCKLTFGKYKDVMLSEIYDINYLEYLRDKGGDLLIKDCATLRINQLS